MLALVMQLKIGTCVNDYVHGVQPRWWRIYVVMLTSFLLVKRKMGQLVQLSKERGFVQPVLLLFTRDVGYGDNGTIL